MACPVFYAAELIFKIPFKLPNSRRNATPFTNPTCTTSKEGNLEIDKNAIGIISFQISHAANFPSFNFSGFEIILHSSTKKSLTQNLTSDSSFTGHKYLID